MKPSPFGAFGALFSAMQPPKNDRESVDVVSAVADIVSLAGDCHKASRQVAKALQATPPRRQRR